MAAIISASQFKARCLGLMDHVAASGEVLVITKNGQPVAEINPGVELHGDLLAPIDSPGQPWSDPARHPWAPLAGS